MSTPFTEQELKALKAQIQERLENLKAKADGYEKNLADLLQKVSTASQNNSNNALSSDLEAFYKKTKNNVFNIKEAADALNLEELTAQGIKKLETAICRALEDYTAQEAHLAQLSLARTSKKSTGTQEILFDAKQGCIKVGRMLSDLTKFATRFVTSCLKSTKAETAQIRAIRKDEITVASAVPILSTLQAVGTNLIIKIKAHDKQIHEIVIAQVATVVKESKVAQAALEAKYATQKPKEKKGLKQKNPEVRNPGNPGFRS